VRFEAQASWSAPLDFKDKVGLGGKQNPKPQNYPECGGMEALNPFHDAMHEVAAREDWDCYVEGFRNYMRAGRRAALEIRRGVA